MNCNYWKDIVLKLTIPNKCCWAAHVLSTCIDEEDSNISQALKCVNEEEVIENTLFAYEDCDSQPYCDEILLYFEKQKVVEIFERIENQTKNMREAFDRFLKL